ncbi:MAG: PASTA domain-containing protein [Gaiellaceae bacterium]
MKRLAIFFGLALLALGPLGVSSAARLPLAGDLDPTFGSGGVVTQSPDRSIGAVAVQPDGKIVVAGSSPFALARYLPDGSLDPSFGAGGHVETDAGAGSVRALALQPDGKIVVAGSSPYGSPNRFTLARYDSSGSLDTTFGTDGITTTVVPTSLDASWTPWGAGVAALDVLPDGKVLAAGSARWHAGQYEEEGEFVLARYTPAGSLDPTFGDGGIVETGGDGGLGRDADLGGMVVLPDGKIVATGTTYGGHPYYDRKIALAGYEPDGSVDFTFDPALTYGRLSGGPSTLQHGKIVVAGSIQDYKKTFPVVARYRANGLIDTTFGKHGYSEVKRAQFAPDAVLTQNDGKILIAGHSNSGGTVLRLLPNGRLDPSFGGRGIVSFDPGTSSLALQQDGKILVGGRALDRLLGGNNCVVPDLRGQTVGKATANLVKSYCRRGSIARRFSSKVAAGRVLSTAPAPGARLPGGAKIHLVVSKGKVR